MDRQVNADMQRVLNRLARGDYDGTGEESLVASPGARVGGCPVKVVSNSSYNLYTVRAVTLGVVGDEPTEIADQMLAFNLAESFTATGSLSPGVYTVMFRVGVKNFFYAVP